MFSTRAKWRCGGVCVLLVWAAVLSGCTLSPLAKHTEVFLHATDLVVTKSENAYVAANELHRTEEAPLFVNAYEASLSFDYYAYKAPRQLITPEGLKVRVELLDALRCYAESLEAVTTKRDTVALDAAAKSLSGNLSGLVTMANADIAAGKTPLASTFTIPAQVGPGIATAIKALGDYLANREVNKTLPQILQTMDDPIRQIALVMEDDVRLLRAQSSADYRKITSDRDQFIRDNYASLSPLERQREIQQIPQLLAEQQHADELLGALGKAIRDLALTHHALAAAAQHNNPESMKDRLQDLKHAESELAEFYSSAAAT